MSTTTVCCTHAALASPGFFWRARAATQRVLQAALAWRLAVPVRPEELDLYALADLSDSTLRDIGAPDGLRAYAAERREQAELLRQVEAYRGGAGLARW
jgi:hypothetical protein